MNINVSTPSYNNGSPNNSVRDMTITLGDGTMFSIVLGIKHSAGIHRHHMRPYGLIPNKLMYSSHIVIVFDFLCNDFIIIKNRYGIDGQCGSVGDINEVISNNMSEIFGLSYYEINELISEINSSISNITGEPIFVTHDHPFGITLRSIRKGEIKNVPPLKYLYKHKF